MKRLIVFFTILLICLCFYGSYNAYIHLPSDDYYIEKHIFQRQYTGYINYNCIDYPDALHIETIDVNTNKRHTFYFIDENKTRDNLSHEQYVIVTNQLLRNGEHYKTISLE